MHVNRLFKCFISSEIVFKFLPFWSVQNIGFFCLCILFEFPFFSLFWCILWITWRFGTACYIPHVEKYNFFKIMLFISRFFLIFSFVFTFVLHSEMELKSPKRFCCKLISFSIKIQAPNDKCFGWSRERPKWTKFNRTLSFFQTHTWSRVAQSLTCLAIMRVWLQIQGSRVRPRPGPNLSWRLIMK